MQFQAHLEIEVPTYFAGNDPLLTYATPLHPEEEHTTTRQELIGNVQQSPDSAAAQEEEQSNSSTESNIKSWSLDHAYLSKPASSGSRGKLVKSKKIDYANIMWPRDALYICYKEDKFEFVLDAEANGDDPYYCDCCDPARQSKKRRYSDDEDEDEDEDDDEEEDEEEEEEDDKVSTTSSSVDSKVEKTEPSTPPTVKPAQPGWFGKGRRKKPRC